METSLLRVLSLYLYLAIAASQTSTFIVTTTTTLTASDPGACNNFVGACVVYGTGNEVAPYTTTVVADMPPPTATVVTATTTATATTTVYISSGATNTGADACDNFSGACVIYYATNGQGAYTSTVYGGSSGGKNNGDGVIGSKGNGDGYIGVATNLEPTRLRSALLVLASNLVITLFF